MTSQENSASVTLGDIGKKLDQLNERLHEVDVDEAFINLVDEQKLRKNIEKYSKKGKNILENITNQMSKNFLEVPQSFSKFEGNRQNNIFNDVSEQMKKIFQEDNFSENANMSSREKQQKNIFIDVSEQMKDMFQDEVIEKKFSDDQFMNEEELAQLTSDVNRVNDLILDIQKQYEEDTPIPFGEPEGEKLNLSTFVDPYMGGMDETPSDALSAEFDFLKEWGMLDDGDEVVFEKIVIEKPEDVSVSDLNFFQNYIEGEDPSLVGLNQIMDQYQDDIEKLEEKEKIQLEEKEKIQLEEKRENLKKKRIELEKEREKLRKARIEKLEKERIERLEKERIERLEKERIEKVEREKKIMEDEKRRQIRMKRRKLQNETRKKSNLTEKEKSNIEREIGRFRKHEAEKFRKKQPQKIQFQKKKITPIPSGVAIVSSEVDVTDYFQDVGPAVLIAGSITQKKPDNQISTNFPKKSFLSAGPRRSFLD